MYWLLDVVICESVVPQDVVFVLLLLQYTKPAMEQRMQERERESV